MPSLYPHEIRKIASGSGASGFAGFYFPSLRAKGLGEEKPTPPYSAIVYKEGDEVRAEDWKGRKIASGESGVDDASVIQSAKDVVIQNGGGILKLQGSFTLDQTIQITEDDPILIQGYAEINGSAIPFEFRGVTKSGQSELQLLENIIFKSKGIKIVDKYATKIVNCNFINCDIGVHLVNEKRFTESTVIRDCLFSYCNVGVKFENAGSSHESFMQTRIEDCDFEMNTVGLEVGNRCAVIRSVFHELTFWFAKDQTAIKIGGNLESSRWIVNFDVVDGGTAIDLLDTYYGEFLPDYFIVLGGEGADIFVNNPHKKRFRIIKQWNNYGCIRFIELPEDAPRRIFEFYDFTNGILGHFAIDSQNRLTLTSGTGKAIVIWNAAAGTLGKILLREIEATGLVDLYGDLKIRKLTLAKGIFPITLGTQSIAAGSTVLAAKFTVPTGKTLKIHAIAELYDPDGYISAEVYNVTDAVAVASVDGFDDTGWSVPEGKDVEFRVINSDGAAAHDGNYGFLVSFV